MMFKGSALDEEKRFETCYANVMSGNADSIAGCQMSGGKYRMSERNFRICRDRPIELELVWTIKNYRHPFYLRGVAPG